MTVEIKINGKDPEDLVLQVGNIYRTFVGDILGHELMKISLNELIEITTEKCKEAGLAVNITTDDAIAAEETVINVDKKTRRAPTDSVKAAPNTSALTNDDDEEVADNEALKAETLERLQRLCYEDGKAVIVNRLRKSVGKRFTEVEADRFPEIVKQLDALLAAAKQ